MNRFILCMVFLSVAACGAGRQYMLPISASQAHSTFEPLVWCAEKEKLLGYQFKDAVHVKVADGQWIYYRINNTNNRYEMALHVTDSKIAAAQHDALFAKLKKIGDTIWACALRPTGPV